MNMAPMNLASPDCASRPYAVDRFVCLLADTDEAKRLHYQLRYKVFCEETKFENPDAFPENAEFDRYDRHAEHFIVWDRQKQRCAGAMRLVDAGATKLPCEEIADKSLDGLDTHRLGAVEFSRLCILNEYRRTVHSTTYGPYRPEGQPHALERPVIFQQEDNDVFLRLLRASLEWRPAVRYCYFIVTAALARVLARFGIPLTRVGEQVEHRGVRIPFRYDVIEALEGMQQTLSGFAAMVKNSAPYIAYSEFVDGDFMTHTFSPAFPPPRFAGGTYRLSA
ncbi:MAG TPA: PEP-CTERM/exosortase system-associated acyltransferase [Lamprocystis sp. (in: g-proteobacteria)]|nr:PEP-CTERM/exosortase system-associated acyltransferase [Lamprocystis sp. (in: g-proteobacteria)]